MESPQQPEIKSSAGKKTSVSLERLNRERLEAKIRELRQYLDCRRLRLGEASPAREGADGDSVPKSAQGVPQEHPHWECARRCLDAAEAALERNSIQEAWAHCHQAWRFLIEDLEPHELAPRAKALRKEAEEKLQNWRKAAVSEILEPSESKVAGAAEVVAAQFLLDQHFDNVYFKLNVLKQRVKSLSWISSGLALGVLALSAVLDIRQTWGSGISIGKLTNTNTSELILLSFLQTLSVLVLGATGAALSNAVSALSGQGRIPRVIQGRWEWMVRLPVGALSAVALVVILQGPLAALVDESSAIYGFAIAAGFSDQLLNRAIRSVEQSIQE